MIDKESLPYRPCVGIMLRNRDGRIFVGQRLDNPDSDAWQMPQGGVDPGEEAEPAAMRELFEETGVAPHHVTIRARTAGELLYDLPDHLVGKMWKGKYRGQRQIWFLMDFTGEDGDIDIDSHHPEFSAWQWVDAARLPDLIVPFKKQLYQDILDQFSEFL